MRLTERSSFHLIAQFKRHLIQRGGCILFSSCAISSLAYCAAEYPLGSLSFARKIVVAVDDGMPLGHDLLLIALQMENGTLIGRVGHGRDEGSSPSKNYPWKRPPPCWIHRPGSPSIGVKRHQHVKGIGRKGNPLHRIFRAHLDHRRKSFRLMPMER